MSASVAAPAGSGQTSRQKAHTSSKQDGGLPRQGISPLITTCYGDSLSAILEADPDFRAFVRGLVQECLAQEAVAQLGPVEAEHARNWLTHHRGDQDD